MTDIEAINTIGASIIEVCSDAWKSAWNDIRGPFNHPDFDNRTRSTLLQALAVIHAKPILDGLGVEYICDETQHIFIVPEKARIIFKKLDEERRPCKNRTDRADALFQSMLFDELPTLVVGMAIAQNWTSAIGIYLYRPKSNALGNSWTLEISNGITAIDADQGKFTELVTPEFDDETDQQTKPKFKPKYDNGKTGESSEEAGSGGGSIGE